MPLSPKARSTIKQSLRAVLGKPDEIHLTLMNHSLPNKDGLIAFEFMLTVTNTAGETPVSSPPQHVTLSLGSSITFADLDKLFTVSLSDL